MTSALAMSAQAPRLGVLPIAYATSMIFTIVATLVAAWLMPTSEFALFTAGVVISALPPMLLAWGIPDAMTFDWLRGDRRAGSSVFSSAAFASLSVCIPAVLLGLILSLRAGFTLVGGSAICALVVCTIFNSYLQGVELAHDQTRRLVKFIVAGGVVTLLGSAVMVVPGQATAEVLLGARAAGAVVLVFVRLALAFVSLDLGSPSWLVIGHLFQRGTSLHLTALLGVGALRLEQMFAVEWFSEAELATFGLIIPVVSGIKQLQHGAGTAAAVQLAKRPAAASYDVARLGCKAAVLSAGLALVGGLFVVVFAQVAGHGVGVSVLAILLLTLSGVLAGVMDVVVRSMRAINRTRPAIWGRAVALLVTVTLGPVLYREGLSLAGLVGMLAVALAVSAMTMNVKWTSKRQAAA